MNAKRKSLGSNLKKVDSHIIRAKEYEEIPELTNEFFKKADLYHGEKLIRRGRPKSDNPRVQVTVRLPQDVLTKWKASGPGWQTRMAAELKAHIPRPVR